MGTGVVLAGNLQRPEFPDALRDRGPERWRWEAGFALRHAAGHAAGRDTAACLGKCAFAVVAEAQARLLERGEWALNEKGIVGRAGLGEAEVLLASARPLPDLVEAVRQALALPGPA